MSAPLKAYRVVVSEWLSHKAVIDAASEADAEIIARCLWANNAKHNMFRFEDNSIDGVFVEEVQHERLLHHAGPCPGFSDGRVAALGQCYSHELPDQWRTGRGDRARRSC